MALDSLDVEGLACVRGGRVVFLDVSFALRAGEALAIEGPNGSGKTSLLRVMAGFLAPERAKIQDGKKLEAMLRTGGIWRDVPAAN